MPEHAAVVDLLTLNGSNGFFIHSGQGEGLGLNLSVGDINGDNRADLLMGARDEDHNGDPATGSAYVLYGSTTPWSLVRELDTMKPKQGFELYGQGEYQLVGEAVAIGDVNGDHVGDTAIGGDGVNGFAGAVFVRYGVEGGLSSRRVATLNGDNGFTVGFAPGAEPYTYLGAAVVMADMDNDGRDEVIVSQPNADHGGAMAGEVHVVWAPVDPETDLVDPSTLEGGDGSGGFTIAGEAGGRLGVSITVGDVNRDGNDDIVITRGDGGGVCVFGNDQIQDVGGLLTSGELDGHNGFTFTVGKRAVLGDLNGDGRDDLIIGNDGAGSNFQGEVFVSFSDGSEDPNRDLNGLNGANGFHITGPGAFSFLGASMEAGDINHDGIDDLILGIPSTDAPGRANAGAVYVVFGRASGFAAEVDLTTLDGSNGFKVIGNAADANYGYSVAAVDMNADGLLDIATGSYFRQEVAVLFGELPTGSVTRLGTAIGQTVHGGEAKDTLGGAGGHDVVVGHGGNDRIGGGAGNDTLDGGAGNDKLDGGAGRDTVSYDAATSGVTANLELGTSTGGGGADALTKIENITGSLYNDTFVGSDGANRIDGSDGADLIQGGGNGDTLIGGADRDELHGDDGADLLMGGSHSDSLLGGVGADTLIGGTGRDTLSLGGADGAVDRVRIDDAAESRPGFGDLIMDMGSGDILDVSRIDADPSTPGNDAFTVVGAFSGAPGQLTLTNFATGTYVRADLDGDGVADLEVTVSGGIDASEIQL